MKCRFPHALPPLQPATIAASKEALIHAAMNIFNFFRKRKVRPLDRVSFTDDAVTRIRPDGIQEMIRWDEIYEISIVTTDEGPWMEDVFFLLTAQDGKSGCAVPQLSEGSQQLLERLQKLPGFDNEAVVQAMGSTLNARFVCWKRQIT